MCFGSKKLSTMKKITWTRTDLYFSSAYNDPIVIFLEIQNTSNLTETISYTLKLRGLRASFGLSDDVSEIPSVLTLPPTGSFLLASGSGADNLFQNSSSAEANTGPDFYNSALISASLKRNLRLRKKQLSEREDNKIIGKRTNKIGQSRLIATDNKSKFKLKWIILLTITMKRFLSPVKKSYLDV